MRILLIVLILAGTAMSQTVEITPSTVPTVKVTPNPWTPEAVLMIIGAVATVLIPSIIALVKAARAERRSEENEERLDRQGLVQNDQLLRESPPKQ
jgi:hypothetical protein